MLLQLNAYHRHYRACSQHTKTNVPCHGIVKQRSLFLQSVLKVDLISKRFHLYVILTVVLPLLAAVSFLN